MCSTARCCGRAASTARFTSTCPTWSGREQILRVHAKKINLAENVDLAVVARGTPGLSGAELANLLNEAALLAARRGKKKVDMADVDDAREKVQFGRERRRVMDDEEKKLTAYHEAGHALVQAILDDGEMPVHKVTIIPRGRSLGSTMFIPKKDILTHAKKRMLNQPECLVAAEEHAGKARGEGDGIDRRMPVAIELHPEILFDPRKGVFLADRDQHVVAGDEDVRLAGRDELRRPRSSLLRPSRVSNHHAGQLAGCVISKALGHQPIQDRDALVDGVLLLPRRGLHFSVAGTHDDLDGLAAKPPSGAATIHGGVAAAKHHDTLAGSYGYGRRTRWRATRCRCGCCAAPRCGREC